MNAAKALLLLLTGCYVWAAILFASLFVLMWLVPWGYVPVAEPNLWVRTVETVLFGFAAVCAPWYLYRCIAALSRRTL